MSERIDHGAEAFRILDEQLLAAEAELEREKRWLEHDLTEEQLVFGWAHNIVDVKNVDDYKDAA